MIKLLLSLIFITISTAISAQERNFVFYTVEGQKIVYENGIAFLPISKPEIQVALSYKPESKDRGWIGVVIQNNSSSPINVNEESLRIYSQSIPLRVYSYTDLMKEQKSHDTRRRIFAVLASSSSSSNNAYSKQQGTYQSNTNANVFGNNGYSATGTARTQGTYQSRTYDATADAINRAEANRRNDELFAKIRAQSANEQSSIQSRALRANTIAPGNVLYGDIGIALPKSSNSSPVEITLQFRAGSETFEARLRESW